MDCQLSKGCGGGSVMHTYGEEFLSETVTVIEFHYNFHCLFVLKSDKYKLLDLHRLKLIYFNFLVLSNFKKVFKWTLRF